MAGSVRLEAHVRTKTLDVGGGERREQTQLVEAGEGTLQPTIVADGARLEIVDVRMALELGERETVDVEALDVAGIDGEERKSLLGEVVNLEQLTGMGIATQTLAVSDNAAGVVGTDARHTAQERGIGKVEGDALGVAQFDRIAQAVGRGFGPLVMDGIDLRCRQIVCRDAYIRLELAILLGGETVEAREVGRTAVDSTLGTVVIDVAHLIGLQTKAEQLGAVGGIGVEGGVDHLARGCGIGISTPRVCAHGATLAADAVGSGDGSVVGTVPQDLLVYHLESTDCQQEEDNHAVAFAEVIGAGQLHRYIYYNKV